MMSSYLPASISVAHIVITVQSSWFGIHRSALMKLLLITALLLPLAGFISQDIHLANSAVSLFIDFQLGLHRLFLLALGCLLLHTLVSNDDTAGTKAAMRSAGVQDIDYLIGKASAVGLLILGFQLFLSLYSWALIKLWAFSPDVRIDPVFADFGTLSSMLHHGATNALGVFLVVNIAHLIWVATQNPLLGFMGSILLWIAGTLKPVWLAFLIHSKGILVVFSILGWVLNLVIPSFHSYDLWIMRNDFGVTELTGYLAIKCIQTMLLCIAILYATWKVASLKRS